MDKVVNILMAEDDQLDVINIQRSLDKMNILYQLHVAKNGEEAIDILRDLEGHGMSKLPDFVLIDINMPRMNGVELLATIRLNDDRTQIK